MWKFLEKLRSRLYEDRYNCIFCGDELENADCYATCPTCMSKLPFNDGNICMHCGKKMLDEADYCLTCQNSNLEFDMCRSAFVYKDDVKHLIYKLKFGGKKYIAKYMAPYYVDIYRKYGYNSDVVVNVPMSENREKTRGYNQSREIAIEVARLLDLPFQDNVVIKKLDLRPQEEFSGRERMENVKSAFRLVDIPSIKGKNVLLIDDVLTTGATIGAVGHQLKKKCKRVDAIVFASPMVKYREVKGIIEDDYSEINM